MHPCISLPFFSWLEPLASIFWVPTLGATLNIALAPLASIDLGLVLHFLTGCTWHFHYFAHIFGLCTGLPAVGFCTLLLLQSLEGLVFKAFQGSPPMHLGTTTGNAVSLCFAAGNGRGSGAGNGRGSGECDGLACCCTCLCALSLLASLSGACDRNLSMN